MAVNSLLIAVDKDLKRVGLRQAEHLELLLMFEDARSRMADVATQPQWNVVMVSKCTMHVGMAQCCMVVHEISMQGFLF